MMKKLAKADAQNAKAAFLQRIAELEGQAVAAGKALAASKDKVTALERKLMKAESETAIGIRKLEQSAALESELAKAQVVASVLALALMQAGA